MGRPEPSQQRVALVSALRQQIGRALAEGRYRFAEHFCDKLLAEEPRDIETWLVKGHLYWRCFSDPAAAVNCFRQVVILGGFESSNECVARARISLEQLLAQMS